MSSTHTSDEIITTQDALPIERVLAVFDHKTERLVAEYPLDSFDLVAFKRRFGVSDESDPLMFDVYPVPPEDVGFVAKYLDGEVTFDFDANAYFIECSTAG